MGGWGISDSAPETEKLKAEMNDLLMGLNSCADIDILTYDKLYTFLIDELFEEIYKLGAVEDKIYLDKEKIKNKAGVYLDELDYYNKITKSGYNTLYNFTMEWIDKIYRLGRKEGKMEKLRATKTNLNDKIVWSTSKYNMYSKDEVVKKILESFYLKNKKDIYHFSCGSFTPSSNMTRKGDYILELIENEVAYLGVGRVIEKDNWKENWKDQEQVKIYKLIKAKTKRTKNSLLKDIRKYIIKIAKMRKENKSDYSLETLKKIFESEYYLKNEKLFNEELIKKIEKL